MRMTSFANSLEAFNDMYRLPISFSPILSWAQATKNPRGNHNEIPTSVQVHEDWSTQVNNFLKILTEELAEIDDILEMFESDDEDLDQLDILTAIADWLGDVAVYSMSEATKYGVADYVPEMIYSDHAGYNNIYEDLDQIESAMLAIRDAVADTVNYHRDLLIGQPSAKNMAKFLTAMIARCYHEAEHFGFNLYDILEIIMASNMSKLGEDGQPIYDERGKVLKGPNYWKPEPKIREYLETFFVLEEVVDEEETDEDFDETIDEGMEDDTNERN